MKEQTTTIKEKEGLVKERNSTNKQERRKITIIEKKVMRKKRLI